MFRIALRISSTSSRASYRNTLIHLVFKHVDNYLGMNFVVSINLQFVDNYWRLYCIFVDNSQDIVLINKCSDIILLNLNNLWIGIVLFFKYQHQKYCILIHISIMIITRIWVTLIQWTDANQTNIKCLMYYVIYVIKNG